ncbi:MAG: DNA replication and repair protein RecF [Acidobacteriota bacterium]
MLVELDARGFRNLDAFHWQPGAGAHLILGPNGAGKTSLLEAIYTLATTRSFRTSRISDCCRHDSDAFALTGEVERQARTRLHVGWQRAGRNRERSVNDRVTSLAEHLDVLPVTAWHSGSLSVLVGPPAERRRFLDRGVIGTKPSTLSLLSRYRKTLDEKRQVLAGGRGPLSPWNELLAQAAFKVLEARASFASALSTSIDAVLADTNLEMPPVHVRYRPSPRCGLEGPEAIHRALADAEKKERAFGKPLLGPQRDELVITWDGRPLREVASAGERKALGLALLAAEGRLLASAGRAPVMLLDDADIELDKDRLERLWPALSVHGQLFATSNRPVVWRDLPFDRRWNCHHGRLDAEA